MAGASQLRSWILLTLVAALAIHHVQATPAKNYVRVVNQLQGAVAVHCHAQGVDLGGQNLNAGKELTFSFYLDKFGNANYNCRFDSGGRWNQFDVFNARGGNTGPCAHCLWAVRADGFYRTEDGPASTPVFIFPWH